jgi:hypothetical protein
MTLPTPPRYVVLPHEVIEQAYQGDKPRRALLASFTRLISLAWEAKYEHTPPMNEEEVITFLKLSRRQYFEQKADMELMGWLRSTHPRPGFVQFSFSRNIADQVSASAKNRTASAENRTGLDVLRIEEDESLKSLNTESSSINTEVRKIAPAETLRLQAEESRSPLSATEKADRQQVVRMISNLPLLFDPMEFGLLEMRPVFRDLEPQFVLGWIVKAYQDREKLRVGGGPIGLIVKRLSAGEAPNPFYVEHCVEILPESYLEKVGGLIEFECGCDFCHRKFDLRAERDAHEKAEHPYQCMECTAWFLTEAEEKTHYDQVHNPDNLDRKHADLVPLMVQADISVTTRLNNGQSMSPAQAWQSVLGQLQIEMPRASFETWVRDTQVVRYDGNALTVIVRNSYARDWLENRIQSTVERMLVGILNQSVKVVFTVAQDVEV